MKIPAFCLLTLVLLFGDSSCGIWDDVITSIFDNGDEGEPLFLTPYIRDGRIKEGRSRSQVIHYQMSEVESYAGYLTVDEKRNSSLFFWFFPALVKLSEILVLQFENGVRGKSKNRSKSFMVGTYGWSPR